VNKLQQFSASMCRIEQPLMASPVSHGDNQDDRSGESCQLSWRWLTSDTSRDSTKRRKKRQQLIVPGGRCSRRNVAASIKVACWCSLLVRLAGPRASLPQPIKCRANQGSGSATGPRRRSTLQRYTQNYEDNDTTWHSESITIALRREPSLL
jgi:hypothetical protein